MSIFKKALEFLSSRKDLQDQINQLSKKVNEVKPEQPCRNRVIYNVSTKHILVIDCNGDSFEGIVESDVVEKLKSATTQEIINLLTPPKEEKVAEVEVEQKDKEIVSSFLDVFEGYEDFEIIGDNVYFKGITSVVIPSLIVARFVELLEQHKNGDFKLSEFEKYQSLKAFTLKLLLNPIKESREDALRFVRNFDIKMTNTGNLIMYRRIVSVKDDVNKDLTEFVSKQYLKVKSWKKSAKNYEVFDDNGLVIVQGEKRHDYNNHKGNLADLYNNLSKLEENRFTDDYTRTYDIRIGATYKIKEKDIDLNKNGSCGGALHVADGVKFSYSAYGDTPVCCIVNPMHIHKMDSGCSGKIGVRQMFIAAVTTQDENGNYEDIDNQDLVNFDELYHNESLEELEQSLKNKSLEVTSVSTALSEVSLKDVETITNLFKKRVVTI